MVSIAFLTDLSETRLAEEALRESHQLVESIVENVPLMIFVKEAEDLRFVEFNKAGEALLGCDREALLGKNDRDLFPPEQAAFFVARDREVLESGAFLDILEEPVLTARNGERLLHTRKVCIKGSDGKAKYLLGISEDITERRLEEDRRQQMSKRLEEKNAELERFAYTISHDLKSPLVTVRTFLGYLQRDMQSQDADGVAEDIDFVLGATEKLARILDELLQLSRVGYLTSPFQEVSLQEVVAEAVGLLAGPIATRGVAVEVVEEPFVLAGDRTRLVEVFLNLLDNAVKNMGEQATPRIVVGVESGGDPLTFFVRDNGIGIDPRYKDQIFNLFEKLDPDSTGTGIGLALVKRIVEVHGGRIWMESAGPGQGSTFRFTVSGARRGAVMEAAQ
jgi:PAS domain S-box-containing protein